MTASANEPKTSTLFNYIAFFALFALPYNTYCVIWYLCAFLWGWEYNNDYPVYFSLWIIQIIILGTWFYYTVKETPEEKAERKKLVAIAIQNVQKRCGDNYTLQEFQEELDSLRRQRQASNDSSDSSSSNN